MKTNNDELLPCPFCDGEPRTIERPDNITGTEFFFSVACYCGGYSACSHKMAVRETPEQAKRDAIAAWNTRAQQPAPIDGIHSCSLHCERPECIKAQRDELRDSQCHHRPPCEECGKYIDAALSAAAEPVKTCQDGLLPRIDAALNMEN